MRYFLKFFAVLGASYLMTMPPVLADTMGKSLRAKETRGFGTLSKARLQKLLTAPAETYDVTGDVQFSYAWIDAQPAASGDNHWYCLSEALYFEARGEAVKGQFAVAEVIMNRVKSAHFPGTVCDVIHQGTGKKYQCQFTYTCDEYPERIREKKAFERVGKIARMTLDGKISDVTGGATHYHTTAVYPRWARAYKQTASIGVHRFYNYALRTVSN